MERPYVRIHVRVGKHEQILNMALGDKYVVLHEIYAHDEKGERVVKSKEIVMTMIDFGMAEVPNHEVPSA